MKLVDWLNLTFRNRSPTKSESIYIGLLATEIWFKELALQAGINLIANTLSRGEFLTYEKGELVRKENYYLLNVEPNGNKSAARFWKDVVSKMVRNNEALVIQNDLQFYCADNFDVKEYAFVDNIYSGITIGELQMQRKFQENEVLRFELHNERIKAAIDGIYNSYAKLIAISQSNYKRNNSIRGVLQLDTLYSQNEQAKKELDNLMQNSFRTFFDAEGSAVVPLSKGMKFDPLASNIGVKSGADGREIRYFIDDIFVFVARGLQIPPQLLLGDVADTDKVLTTLLTTCINPLAEIITDEVNRKVYGKKAFLERTYCKLDTTHIKAVEIKDIANSLDVLTRIGAYCIDDCLTALGMEPFGAGWSQKRYMTKNYQEIEGT